MYIKTKIPYIFLFLFSICALNSYAQSEIYSIKSSSNKYAFANYEIPDEINSVFDLPATGISYQWEESNKPLTDFIPINGEINEELIFDNPLSESKYYRRKIIFSNNTFIYSNTLKIEAVSSTWENLNYNREYEFSIPIRFNDWLTVDDFQTGEKNQTTVYFDGLGRPIQQVNREMGSPISGNSNETWRDIVKPYVYDEIGRQSKSYLPYTTTENTGKYKENSLAFQEQYYQAFYDDTHPYALNHFGGGQMNMALNVKGPGGARNASNGYSSEILLNTKDEDVRIFSIGYSESDLPVTTTTYNDYELIKKVSTDERGNTVLEYYNFNQQILLKKVQVDAIPSINHSGWICTYYVYDDFGNLRATIEGEAVKWLDQNGWSFSSGGGDLVFFNLCFLYVYDDKGRVVLKKTPGNQPLRIIYNKRDLPVFMQDGNQNKLTPPEWTVNFYDPLDRLILTTLYKTDKSVEFLQEQVDLATYGRMELQNFGGGAPLFNLVVPSRNVNISNYNAQESIEFVQGFESMPGDEFEAEIDPVAQTYPVDISLPRFQYPISEIELNDPHVCTILKYNFYDQYTFTNVKSFDHSHTNSPAPGHAADQIYPTERTWSMPTGSMVRVLESDLFLNSTFYYDEKGRSIQSLSENIKSGEDIITLQYRHDGTLLSTSEKHYAANSDFNGYVILTRFLLDKIGRVSEVEKKFGTNDYKSVAAYLYDDLGRLKDRRLAPRYGGSFRGTEMELLSYSYDIVGSLTGINKDYALKTAGVYEKWNHFFGQYFEYDNKSQLFAEERLDGKITGTVWNTQGDDAQRFYNYEYDIAGRFIAAQYYEKQTPGGILNSAMNFSVTGNNNGKINYDLNGNIKSMIQMGVVFGSQTPVAIDNLAYTHHNFSNQLHSVNDNTTLSTLNGSFGDFKNGNVGSNPQYIYDDNGNLIVDWNKNALIEYNFLDKPRKITLSGKGVIDLVYDADGNRLQRKFTPVGSSPATTTTTYVGSYVYKEDEVQFIQFEEGRLRLIESVDENNGYDFLSIDGNIDLPGDKRGSFDYYISDHLGNVRMIVTEQTHIGGSTCTLEETRAANEETVFGEVDANGLPAANNEVAARFPVANIPGQSTGNGWENPDIGNHVSRLGNMSAAGKVGPNSLLKVMAGDEISAQTWYYYKNSVSNGTGNNLLSSIISALTNALSGSNATSDDVKSAAGNITAGLNTNLPFTNATNPDAPNNLGTSPKAYLTVLFFDERFNFVEEGSESIRVSEIGDMLDPQNPDPLQIISARAPKNGYAYIYISNESDEHVYFDNLQITHERGRLIEENHYYAYGLKIAAISSVKLGDIAEGSLKNNYLYQGDYSELDNDIGWYDFALRSYDAQLGRFWQSDPYDEFASPYLGMGNDPVNLVDPTGGCVTCMQTLETVVMVGQTASVGLAGIMNVIGPAMNVLGMAGNYYNLINSKISPNTLDPSSPTKTIFDPNNPQTLEGVTIEGKIKKKSWFKRNLGNIVDVVQTGLDILGSTEIPIISQIADIGSAGISFAQGDFKGAGLSLLGTVVPGASQAKLALKMGRVAKGGTTVYTSVSKGVTQYVGITNNVARRSAEHLASKGINIQPLMKGLSRTDARAVEQALIEIHGLGKNGGTLLNKINSISLTNPAYGSQLQRGYELLKTVGY